MKLPQDVSGEELAKALGMRFINYGARTADGGRGMTEGHYELPKGWRWARLGEVCAKPQYGVTQSASQEPVGPKFLRITDITSGYIDWDKVPYCQADQRALEKYRLTVGDILFARSGSVGAIILIKEQPPVDAVFASYLIRVRVNQTVVLPEFVELFVKSNFGQSQLVPRGAAQKNINAKRIQQIFIPLPPLPEQRRIVARIEELMERVREAKRLREEAKKDADRLMQAALAEVFPRPGAPLSPGWKLVKLGEVVVQCIGGTWGTGDDPDGVGVLRPNNIGENGEIVWEDIRWRNVSVSQLQKRRLRDGDIILTKSNSLEQVGRAALFQDPNDDRTYVPSNFLQLLRPDPSIVQPEYLHYILRTRQYVAFVQRTAIGSSASLKNLSARALKEFRFPLPPLVEQRRIVAYLDQLQARMTALQKAQESTEAELHRLEQTILDKAFRGEL